jgi:hypothetical protein
MPAGWLRVQLEPCRAQEHLCGFSRIEITGEKDARTYFKIIKGYRAVGQLASMKTSNANRNLGGQPPCQRHIGWLAMKMKHLSLAIATTALLGCAPGKHPQSSDGETQASSSATQGCGDLLARLEWKPPAVRYIGCTAFPERQAAPVRAVYAVAGRDAAAVEAYLIRSAGLKPLKRSCCQWDSEPVRFIDSQGLRFTIAMMSDETAVSRREDWEQIAAFHITVEMLTDEI